MVQRALSRLPCRCERLDTIAALVPIRHEAQSVAVRNDGDSAHQTAFRGVDGAKPSRSGTAPPLSATRTAINA